MKVLLTATVQSHICQFHKPLVEVLHSHGYEVHVAARNNLAEKNGLKLDFVDKIFNVPFARSPKSKENLCAYKELKKIIEKEQYEVIHCNTPMGGIVTRLAARNARKRGTKVYYTAHGFHFYKGAPKKNWIVFYPIEKLFSRITDKLITITQEDYELASHKFYCKVERIHGVGVDEDKFCITSSENSIIKEEYQGKIIVLCIGELNKNKNQITVIKAIQKLREKYPQILLLLAGNGPEEIWLKEQVREMQLEGHVEFLGYRTDLEKFVNLCYIVVSASKREGLPMNIMEAMICGKPVVASENRGHKELVINNKTGFLVPFWDEIAFEKKIEKLITDNLVWKEFSLNAKSRSVLYNSKGVKKELEKVYME